MGKIIKFPAPKQAPEKDLLVFKEMADQIDVVIKTHYKAGVPILDIIGVIGHRLGKFILTQNIDERKFYFKKINKIIKKYAEIDD